MHMEEQINKLPNAVTDLIITLSCKALHYGIFKPLLLPVDVKRQ